MEIFRRSRIPGRVSHLKRALAVAALICASVPLASCNHTASGDIADVCSVLQTDAMANLAVDLLKDVSDGEWGGGLAANIVINEVQDHCDPLLTRAVTAVQGFFGAEPQQTKVASLTSFQTLSALADSSIASQLNNLGYQVSSSSVATLVSDLCADVQGSRNSTPAQDVQALLPQADLGELTAMNGVTAQVSKTCTPFNSFEADGLVTNVYESLLANESLATTPLVITSFTWSWVAAGEIQVTWSSTYQNVPYSLWVNDGGQWQQLVNDSYETTTPVSSLEQGYTYQFALRAFANGTASPWAYMTPCLTCAS